MSATQEKRQVTGELPRWDGPLSHPFYSKVVKRVLDFTLALILLPPCLILMLPIALAVKLTSKGPILYSAPRGGYHNKTFHIFKFRTMVVGADRFSSTTAFNDPRVTKVGRILRMTKLDELPQLFNILKGEMSFIGPRPEVLLYTTQYTPEQECILWVRPGITDPSSIKLISLDKAVGHDDPEGTYEREILGEKNRMRVQYATTQCFTGDFKIFFATFGALFRKLFVPEPADEASQAANQGGQQ
jgi:lipopolysaccharide/colanic/teichoic acid biosynthesis glycosyltransferase